MNWKVRKIAKGKRSAKEELLHPIKGVQLQRMNVSTGHRIGHGLDAALF